MNWSAFEKHVQATLQNREEVVDTDQLISALFREEKKKKIFPWWWMLGALITGGIIAWFLAGTSESADSSPVIAETTVAPNNKGKSATLSSDIALEAKNNAGLVTGLKETKRTATDTKRMPAISDYLASSTISDNSKMQPVLAESQSSEAQNVVENEKLVLSSLSSTVVSAESMFPLRFPRRKTVQCPSFSNRKRLSFFLQPEIGFGLPQKNLQGISSEISDAVQRRIDQEETLEGLQAALYLGMNIGRSPWYVKTGLAYTRLAEKMDLQYEYTRQDTTYGIISITKSQTGDTLTVIYGDIITQSTIEGQKIKHHYFHLFDIPLCVGYQFPVSSKWSVNAEAGLVFNAAMRVKGDVLATGTDFLPATANNYQPSLGIGYRAGLDVEYAATSRIGLGLQARINGYGRDFSSGNADFRQQYVIPGAQLYLKYYFTN